SVRRASGLVQTPFTQFTFPFAREHLSLGKRDGRIRVLEFSEVTQTNANEAKESFRTKIDPLTQGKCNRRELLARCWRDRRRVAAGVDIELSRLQFEHYGSRAARFSA